MRTFAQPLKKTTPAVAWPPKAPAPAPARRQPAAHRLQRAIGNRASRELIQRNEESAELLTKLAKPQTFVGPEVEVQIAIATALDKQFDALLATVPADKQALYNVTCLGGIVLNPTKGTSAGDLIDSSKLIDLPPEKSADPRSRAIGTSTFALAQAAKVEEQIVLNTLATMQHAGQLEYLRKSGLLSDKEWEIVIEIHYYRDRSPDQTRLHKDTKGQTIFVNLNYVNAEPIQGPEFVMNPELDDKEIKKTYLEYMQEKLPPEFIKDVEAVKTYYGEPKVIGMSEIPAYGVVAFVDEAIHHKTPTMGHRRVKSWYIDKALAEKYADEYQKAKKALGKYRKRQARKGAPTKKTYGSYLKAPKIATADEWYKILSKIEDPEATFDRKDLAAMFPRAGFLDIEALIEDGGFIDFGRASMLHAKRENVAIKKEGRPPLTRQMSQEMLGGYKPLVSAGPRRFFRTWVRAVRKGEKV